MRNLIGLEMICFERSRHFELVYEQGRYWTSRGEEVEGLADMSCYVCSTAYFTTRGDGIDFCPGCGHFDRRRFESLEALKAHLQGVDFSWLKINGLSALKVETWDGYWRLFFHSDPAQLDASGRFKRVHSS